MAVMKRASAAIALAASGEAIFTAPAALYVLFAVLNAL